MRHIPTVPHQTVVTNTTQLGERMCSMIEFMTVQSQLIYLIVQTLTKVSRCNFTTKILNFFKNTLFIFITSLYFFQFFNDVAVRGKQMCTGRGPSDDNAQSG